MFLSAPQTKQGELLAYTIIHSSPFDPDYSLSYSVFIQPEERDALGVHKCEIRSVNT